MNSVTSLLDRVSATSQTKQTTHTPSSSPELRVEILKAMRTLKAMGLITFLSNSTDYAIWEAGLLDLAPMQIKRGAERAKDCVDYMTLPRFRELCRITPEDMGLKTAKAAYIEACNMPLPWERGNWSHGAVYHAARETGRFELHTLTERECFPLFKTNYETICSRVMNGEVLDRPVQKVLPESVPNPTPPEVAKVRLAALKGML